jgi:hypothetical protein
MPSRTFTLSLYRSAIAVPVSPGAEIAIEGSFYSRHDGSIIDGATTTWPSSAPGGASVDATGLFDFPAGGFRLVSRDPTTHQLRAIATGDEAPGCAEHDVASPCLLLRSAAVAHSRLLTVHEWANSLEGSMTLRIDTPPIAIAESTSEVGGSYAGVGVACGVAVLVLCGVFMWFRCRAVSPKARLLGVLKRVRHTVERLDPVLSAVLVPAFRATEKAVRRRQIDPVSDHGQRVAETFNRLEGELLQAAQRKRASQERQAANHLIEQVSIALEAAHEVARGSGGNYDAQANYCGSA